MDGKDESTQKSVKLSHFSEHLYKTEDGEHVVNKYVQICEDFGFARLETRKLTAEYYDKSKFDDLLYHMLDLWICKQQETNVVVTIKSFVDVGKRFNINSLGVTLRNKWGDLDTIIVNAQPEIPETADPQVEKPDANGAADQQWVKEMLLNAKTSEDSNQKDKGPGEGGTSCFRALLPFKKGKGLQGGLSLAAGIVQTKRDEEDVEIVEETVYLTEEDAENLQVLITEIRKVHSSLRIKQYLCEAVYRFAVAVPVEDNWIGKVALIAMEMFSIIRQFIQPGVAMHKNSFEAVVRSYSVDPELAPQLIKALVECRMFIPKEGDKKSVLLIEPAVKQAIDELQEMEPILKFLESTYPKFAKVQEKLLMCVARAVAQHRDPSEAKNFGKKLSPHISYLVTEIVWPLKHPGFRNVQAKIPKLIKFCNESVVAIAYERYKSLPNVSDKDMEIFEKAYKRAKEERMNLRNALGMGAVVGLGLGAGALAIGAGIATMSDDEDD